MKNARRADIDTLRAVSVISVIFFHLDQSFFPNGYLGVDIFFVISGFVITKSIIKNIRNNKFSFLEFYFKRIKRILPVFLVVLLTTIIFASFIFLIADLKRFLESLISSLGFVSNFYFWISGGYFSTNDQLKPLLHIWSLSVEEQFYLFFPIFFYLLYKLKKNLNFNLFIIFLIISLSFAMNIFFISKGHRDVIFFMFPARIWQFGLGVFVAMLPLLKIKNIWLDFFYVLGAIILIIINFTTKIKFLPDATLMCLGVSLILYKVSNTKNFLNKIFNIKPLIFIGVISFSLYLWHWPIISILKYIHIDQLPFDLITFCIIMIFTLSFFSWKYVEQPFLYKYKKKQIYTFVTVNYLVLMMCALFILQSNNFPSRYDKFPNKIANSIGNIYNCSRFEYIKFGDTYACLLNSKGKKDNEQEILFGNSHAYMYGWPFKKHLLQTNQSGLIIQLSSCLPFVDKNISQGCLKKSRAYLEEIKKDNDIKNVIIGFTWYTDKFVNEKGEKFIDDNFEIRKKSIDNLINNLIKNDKNVYLIGPIDIPGKKFSPETISREIIFKGKKDINFANKRINFDKKYKEIINYYELLLGENFLQPSKILCDKKNCYFGDNEGSYFADSNHLSKYGSDNMYSLFEKIY